MKSINKLGLLIVILIAGVFVLGYAVFAGLRMLFPDKQPVVAVSSASPTPATKNSSGPSIETDTDSDGLPDLIESSYLSDPMKEDTDGDGTNDGDEVALQRNPAKAGPEDPLPSAEQLENAQKTLSYTDQYLATLPSEANQAEVLNKERIEAFIHESQGQLLPEVPDSSIKTTDATGKEAVQAYLDAISSTHNSELQSVTSQDIDEAFRLHYSNNSPEQLQAVIDKLEKNITVLAAVEAPQETLEMHKKLIAASQALLNNTKLLQNMPKDFVGGLLGAKNIEDLGPVFQQISSQVTELETKYDLK